MKILVVSLLRLGDLILHSQMIYSLRQTYPQAEIHFLINSQFSMAAELLPNVSQWHFLDRNKIQKILVEQNQSPMAAFDRLRATVQGINAEKYDLVLNATHNMLSVRLMDLIEAKEKRGAQFHQGKKLAFNNLWLQYFNDQFSESNGSRFHYIEILHRALDLNPPKISQQIVRSEGPIVMQVLTADEKKNWGISNFAELKKQILADSPQQKIFALCSPGERAQVSAFFSSEEILSPTMQEAKALLQQAKLLITGDTSIQHLAAVVLCPTLALHLGSADPVKTSPWMRGAQLIQGKASCRPCRHSEKCHQPRHLCGDGLSVQMVAARAMQFLKNRSRTQILQNGDHHFFCDETELSQISFKKLEQLTWAAYLNRQQVDEIFILPEVGELPRDTEKRFQALELHLSALAVKIEKISSQVFDQAEQRTDELAIQIKHQVQDLRREFPEIADSFSRLIQSFEVLDRSFFEFLKGLRAGLKESLRLNEIRQRLISIELRNAAQADKLNRDQGVSVE